MAGVINYVLKKEYTGGELAASAGANSQGDGRKRSASGSFGFGNLATQRFNVFGGLEISQRDPVTYREASRIGRQSDRDAWLIANSTAGTPRGSSGSSAWVRPSAFSSQTGRPLASAWRASARASASGRPVASVTRAAASPGAGWCRTRPSAA
mgnify:CR=1 FL=1